MLSRIAEALYWTGRYTERAEDTARLLDVAQRAALEGSDLAGRDTLAGVLGGPPARGSRSDILGYYGLDRSSPQSIASCVRLARENARTIRDAVTSEMWEALNSWHLRVASAGPTELTGAGAHAFLSDMKQRAFLFMGSAHATMLREEGWHWLRLGRYLERCAFTCRFLGIRADALTVPAESAGVASQTYGWTVLLRAMSAYEAYRATYRAGVDAARVIEFLLLDMDFPRSAVACARQLEASTLEVTGAEAGDTARRLAGRLRAELEFREVEEVLDEGLATFVWRLVGLLGQMHDAVGDEQFARGAVGGIRAVAG